MRRRALLALVGTSLTAGCSTVSGLFDGEQHVGLGSVVVNNWDDEPHTVTVRVSADGERLVERTYEVASYDEEANVVDGAVLPCEWRGVAGSFVVEARHESSDGWARFDLAEEFDGDDGVSAVAVNVFVGHSSRDGDVVSFWTSGNPQYEDCPGDATTDTPKENAF
jgi:hypothetical protein